MNNIKSIFLVTGLVFSGGLVFGQSDALFYKNQLKISPVRIIDLVNPGIELGYERRHSQMFSTQIALAYMKDFIGVGTFDEFEGFRVSLEEKKFLDNNVSRPKYISLELVYSSTNFQDESRFGYEDPWSEPLADTYNYLDSYSASKRMIILNLKAGFQIIIKRLAFDISTGLGLKYKNIDHDDRLVPDDKMERPRHFNAFYYASAEGKKITANLPINFKIGWGF